MKKLEIFLKICIFAQLGACVGRIVYRYIDYRVHPMVYAVQSAPWYLDCFVTLVLTAVTVGITSVIYLIIRHKNRAK